MTGVCDVPVRELEGLTLHRVLPLPGRRSIGPVVFVDHLGPVEFAAGAGLDVRIGLDGRVPLLQDLRIYCNAGAGPSIPDGEIVWMVRVGLALMIDANIGAEFGYRLFDFDLSDGPSQVDGGLRGLFGGVSVRF